MSQRVVERVRRGASTLLLGEQGRSEVALYASLAEHISGPLLVVAPRPRALAEALERTSPRLRRAVLDAATPAPTPSAWRARLVKPGPSVVVVDPALVCAPEWQALWKRGGAACLAVAGAHGLTSAAHEIRPALFRIGAFRETLGAPPLVAVTGLCSEPALARLQAALELAGADTLHRPRLGTWHVEVQSVRANERQPALASAVERLSGTALAYAATPQEADAAFAELKRRGLPAFRCHPGMSSEERAHALAEFRTAPAPATLVVSLGPDAASGLLALGELDLGLGVLPVRDDVELVVHLQAPSALERWYESLSALPEGGRTLMLVDGSDLVLSQAVLAQHRLRPSAVVAVVQSLQALGAERTTTAEALALRAGQSRRATEKVVLALADLGLLRREGAALATRVPPEILEQQATEIVAALVELREGDARRGHAVGAYSQASGDALGRVRGYVLPPREASRC